MGRKLPPPRVTAHEMEMLQQLWRKVHPQIEAELARDAASGADGSPTAEDVLDGDGKTPGSRSH